MASPTMRGVQIEWLSSDLLHRPGRGRPDPASEYDGLLVPGGFGVRGVEGMIEAIRWAREHDLPFFGICLGLQIAIIEFARNVCRLPGRQQHRVRARVRSRRSFT